MFKDNKDFYPTPKALFYKLMNGTRYISGRILEPSAGKGDLIRYIKELNRNVKIDAIEKDSRLSGLLMSEGINVVWDDFLTYETYKEYDLIVMNPPFSNGVDHVLKALELAEAQISSCEIYAILNKETLDNAYSSKRQELLRKLNDYDAEIRYVKDAFTSAERKTDVEIALINVVIVNKGEGKSIYDSIPFIKRSENEPNELETALSTYVKSNEVRAKINDIERLVLEYEKACEVAKTAFKVMRNKSSLFSYFGKVNKKDGEIGSPFTYVTKKGYTAEDLNNELDSLRRIYWELILDTGEFKALLTNESRQKLNRQLEAANEMEINITNIKTLLTALGANREEMLIDSIISIFKRITRYHMNQYSTNIHYYDGWKTNNAYKINKKIIIPIQRGGFDEWDYREDFSLLCLDVREFIEDIVKAFQLIDHSVSNEFTYVARGEFENDLLRFKMFNNGNIHVWFNRLDLLNKLNYICGSHLAWIPSDDEVKTNKKAREFVVKEFGDGVLSSGLIVGGGVA
ncbi:DUF4942 domain-containing protein [Virgibacillus proomii]|uniref:DUF4942 domain-containing protein n=1 Tax=Virgibacillus proomii TaxID=84407 RepID=UPI001C108CC8|nr:DUF4942 domain-containing protein [Virgibacillus proomii]MBU5266273.1 DUF4942 domain-containing protein [Virgibacillus proomii]